MVKPVIRRMRFSDLEAVLALERQAFDDPWSRDSFEFEIANCDVSLPVVLEVEGQMIGYAVVWSIFDEWHIANLAIHPWYRRKGWGRYLLEELLNMAEGKTWAFLEVREHNQPAIRLYEKLGFKKAGVRYRYYRGGENAILMRKRLG